MRVRTAHRGDVREIAALHVRAWQRAYRGLMPDFLLDSLSVVEREAEWKRAMSHQPQLQVLVVDVDHRVLGFSAAGPSRDGDAARGTAEVYAIYVDPDHVGTGLGRILLAHTLEDFRSRGYRTATLWVLEGNDRARRFYELAGWRANGATRT